MAAICGYVVDTQGTVLANPLLIEYREHLLCTVLAAPQSSACGDEWYGNCSCHHEVAPREGLVTLEGARTAVIE